MLIVDTGPLVATADRDDADHAVYRELLEGDAGPLVTTALVVAEAAYLVDRQLGPAAEVTLYDSILDGSLPSRTPSPATAPGSGSWSPPMIPVSAAPTPAWWPSPSGWAPPAWPR